MFLLFFYAGASREISSGSGAHPARRVNSYRFRAPKGRLSAYHIKALGNDSIFHNTQHCDRMYSLDLDHGGQMEVR